MSSIRSQRLFFRRVGEALSPYQLVEAILKIYVAKAHLRIERTLAGKVPFNYPSSEYENAALGQLISLFKRHSNNNPLITRLKAAKEKRNYIAHKIIEDYMHHHEKNPKIASGISRKLKKIQSDGYDLVEDMLQELRVLDDLDDAVREVLAKREKASAEHPNTGAETS
jgi:hypothetical protein